MRRRRFLNLGGAATIAYFGSGWPARGQSSGRDNPTNAQLVRSIERVIPGLLSESQVPGVAVALVREGKLLWSGGFGLKSSDGEDPVVSETIFEAASVSKTVFAYAILQLCDKGGLELDRPLTTYVPWRILKGDPRVDQMTARHILSHSSGFQDWRSGENPLKIHFDPGEKFMYSGEGYFYLQSVLTHLTGRIDSSQCAEYEAGLEVCATDFDAYMKGNLLEPFGMFSSTYEWAEHLAKRIARGHDVNGRPNRERKARGSDVARYGAAGGLLTTVNDFAKFIVEIVTARPEAGTAKGDIRLSASRLSEMARPQIKLPPDQLIDGATAWALGWGAQEGKDGNYLVHSGGQAGFRSLAIVSPAKRSGFILLTNSDNGGKLIHHPALLEPLDLVLRS